MSEVVKLSIIFIVWIALGVLFCLAGYYGWQYPRTKYDNEKNYKKLWVRYLKLIIGLGLVISGIGGFITKVIL